MLKGKKTYTKCICAKIACCYADFLFLRIKPCLYEVTCRITDLVLLLLDSRILPALTLMTDTVDLLQVQQSQGESMGIMPSGNALPSSPGQEPLPRQLPHNQCGDSITDTASNISLLNEQFKKHVIQYEIGSF